MASLAGLALGTFVAALATIAALAIFQTQLIAPDRAVLVLKVVPVAFVLGALMLHRWLWAEYVDSRVSAIAAA